MGELAIYEGQMAIAKTSGTGYKIESPLTGHTVKLERDVDFGVVPGTKSPSLYKSGAEKVAMAYGLMQRFTVESAMEVIDPEPFFYYRVRCDLVKVANNGVEYIFCSGEGSANTREKRNGRNDAYNSANSTLKMAQKRALVQAALAVSGLSSMFTQDMENETFMNNLKKVDPVAYRELMVQDQQIAAVQKARERYNENKDLDEYIAFWEAVWANGGLEFGGAKWHFELPDMYIKANRYDDALVFVLDLKEQNPEYSYRSDAYIKKIQELKAKKSSQNRSE